MSLYAIEDLRTMAARLLATSRSHFPYVLDNDAPAIKIVTAGLLARIVGGGEAALHLSVLERRADLAVVERSVFEHVVMLAWLTGADSEERIARWQADDELNRGKIDAELTKLTGTPVLSPENRARVDAIKASVGNRSPLPPLTERAEAADRDWQARFQFSVPGTTEHHPLYSLRAAYSTLYRLASSVAHPTIAGLNFVSTRAGGHTVTQIEPTTEVAPTFGLMVALLGTALYISADVLGFPRAQEVTHVFDSAPSPQTPPSDPSN